MTGASPAITTPDVLSQSNPAARSSFGSRLFSQITITLAPTGTRL
jgi:hypothetical protein